MQGGEKKAEKQKLKENYWKQDHKAVFQKGFFVAKELLQQINKSTP